MRKPVLLWVDLTTASRHAELPEVFTEACDIRVCTNLLDLVGTIEHTDIDGLCFDMDYPDRRGLELLRNTKARFPSLPIVFITLQHSESLAVWAFRTRVLDYLVKPVSRSDVQRSMEILVTIGERSRRQGQRQPLKASVPIPIEVPYKARADGVDLMPAIFYVKQKFREKIFASEVARICGMDAFRFSRAFRAQFGLTFRGYLLRYRILEACRLLRDPNSCVTNVAFAVGFNDASYFAKVFRRLVGTSPSDYGCEFELDAAERRISSMRSTLPAPAPGWPD